MKENVIKIKKANNDIWIQYEGIPMTIVVDKIELKRDFGILFLQGYHRNEIVFCKVFNKKNDKIRRWE